MLSSPFFAAPNSLILRSPSSAVPTRLPRRLRLQSPRCAAAAASTAVPLTPLAAAAKSTTLYDVLGVPACATGGEIKAAYRRLALECHPDAVAAAGGRKEGASADEFMRVHAAYATLSDPEKRAEYDRGAVTSAPVAGRRRSAPEGYRPFYSSGSSSGGGRRTWETDQCW